MPRNRERVALARIQGLARRSPALVILGARQTGKSTLAKLAFPGDDVILDDHARTVDLLRAHPEWRDPLFLIGADEFAGFLSWKEPAEVLRRARLGVATRPGFGFESLAPVLGALGKADRITFFEIEPLPIASRELRVLLEAGDDVSAHIPASVAAEIDRRGLYGRHQGYTR